jgi:endonuclease/exonuclease/phosphatase (EEP) superfamily protein YafD
LPYTPIWPKEVKTAQKNNNIVSGSDLGTDQQLSVITANVLKKNRNSDALISLVKQYQPDILVTLESDKWWEDKLDVLTADMPYSIKCPLDNLYGMHVYSRLPICDEKVAYLVEDDIPSIHVSVLLRSGDKVRMYFVHPAPPSPTENTESAERDAELITIARHIGDTTQPVIVTGDLNDVAWSRTTRLFRKISGLLDPRVGRGIYNTFHVSFPFLRWPLDHIFHSPHFTLKTIHRLQSIGSDHFALYTVLAFTPGQDKDQAGLTAAKEDKVEAEKISAKMDSSKGDIPQLSN